MKVLIVEPGKYPRRAEIDGGLQSMQEIVGGLIQPIYPWEDCVALVCNDEGKLMGLPLNRSLENYDIIAGTFLICGVGQEDFCSLTDAQMERYEAMFKMPELFFRTENGVKGRPCPTKVHRLFMCETRDSRKNEDGHER